MDGLRIPAKLPSINCKITDYYKEITESETGGRMIEGAFSSSRGFVISI